MKRITNYFPALSPLQISMFEKMEGLYLLWNERINVISRKDIGNLYERHILHSLSIAKVIQFAPGARILDAGTGGGFPGIPLAIVFPGCNFHLVDSIGKKIKVVESVAGQLGLDNVTAQQSRVEDISQKYDFITGRAVANLPDFVKWTKNKINRKSFCELPNGILYLRGNDDLKNIKELVSEIKTYSLKNYFNEPFFNEKYLLYIRVNEK